MKLRIAALATGALITAIAFTGCAAGPGEMDGMDHGSTADPDVAANVNPADETFAMEMIAHHQQAIEMADLVLAKSGVDPVVLELAADIKAAQQPEIELMTSWLTDWGVAVEGMDGMGHGSGMMSEDDMSALEAADGAAASTHFLDQMIEHHEGAIAMAETEVEQGQNRDALELAEKVIIDQTSEIEFMQILRASL